MPSFAISAFPILTEKGRCLDDVISITGNRRYNYLVDNDDVDLVFVDNDNTSEVCQSLTSAADNNHTSDHVHRIFKLRYPSSVESITCALNGWQYRSKYRRCLEDIAEESDSDEENEDESEEEEWEKEEEDDDKVGDEEDVDDDDDDESGVEEEEVDYEEEPEIEDENDEQSDGDVTTSREDSRGAEGERSRGRYCDYEYGAESANLYSINGKLLKFERLQPSRETSDAVTRSCTTDGTATFDLVSDVDREDDCNDADISCDDDEDDDFPVELEVRSPRSELPGRPECVPQIDLSWMEEEDKPVKRRRIKKINRASNIGNEIEGRRDQSLETKTVTTSVKKMAVSDHRVRVEVVSWSNEQDGMEKEVKLGRCDDDAKVTWSFGQSACVTGKAKGSKPSGKSSGSCTTKSVGYVRFVVGDDHTDSSMENDNSLNLASNRVVERCGAFAADGFWNSQCPAMDSIWNGTGGSTWVSPRYNDSVRGSWNGATDSGGSWHGSTGEVGGSWHGIDARRSHYLDKSPIIESHAYETTTHGVESLPALPISRRSSHGDFSNNSLQLYFNRLPRSSSAALNRAAHVGFDGQETSNETVEIYVDDGNCDGTFLKHKSVYGNARQERKLRQIERGRAPTTVDVTGCDDRKTCFKGRNVRFGSIDRASAPVDQFRRRICRHRRFSRRRAASLKLYQSMLKSVNVANFRLIYGKPRLSEWLKDVSRAFLPIKNMVDDNDGDSTGGIRRAGRRSFAEMVACKRQMEKMLLNKGVLGHFPESKRSEPDAEKMESAALSCAEDQTNECTFAVFDKMLAERRYSSATSERIQSGETETGTKNKTYVLKKSRSVVYDADLPQIERLPPVDDGVAIYPSCLDDEEVRRFMSKYSEDCPDGDEVTTTLQPLDRTRTSVLCIDDDDDNDDGLSAGTGSIPTRWRCVGSFICCGISCVVAWYGCCYRRWKRRDGPVETI